MARFHAHKEMKKTIPNITKRSGVKPADGSFNCNRKQVSIDENTEVILKSIGKGNLSLGIREASRRLVETNNIKPFKD
jgi:hypothetical protein